MPPVATSSSITTLSPVFDALFDTAHHPVATCRIRDLSRLVYAQGFTAWLYRDEAASIDDIERVGFFEPASGMVKHSDAITVICAEGVAHRWLDTRGGPIVLRRCA